MAPDSGLNARASNTATSVNDTIIKPSRKKRKSEVTSATTKDAQAKKTKGKAKVGQLEGLMSLPMDVLFEVLCYLLLFRFLCSPTPPDIRAFTPT
jgi:hypothetical protein